MPAWHGFRHRRQSADAGRQRRSGGHRHGYRQRRFRQTIQGRPTAYDNELLDAHFITGDGRGNENIGLTAVHTIFHSEHNRLVEANKDTLIATGDAAAVSEWLAVGSGNVRATISQTALDAINALHGRCQG